MKDARLSLVPATAMLLALVLVTSPKAQSPKPAPHAAANQAAARSLRLATIAITAQFRRERQGIAPLMQSIQTQGLTQATDVKIRRSLQRSIDAYQQIKTKLDHSTPAPDLQLAEAIQDLSTWLKDEITVYKLYFTSNSLQDWTAKIVARFSKTLPDLDKRLRYLAAVVQSRFPQAYDWRFLPSE
jgi:hypothetical protein